MFGSVLEGRGGGGRSWVEVLLRWLVGVFEGCLVDGGLGSEGAVVLGVRGMLLEC